MAEGTTSTTTTSTAVANVATVIPEDIFDHVARNAGVILTSFDPTTGTVTKANILGATSGGVKFTDTVEYIDYGEDIDNCPKNMKELKRIDSHEAVLAGDMVSASKETIKKLVGAADLASGKITPRADLDTADFGDLWYVVDYGKGGYIAIKMLNTLNTAGFAIEAKDREKGIFAFEFMAHYSMSAQDTVPYEIYVKDSVSTTTTGGTTAQG